MKLYYFDVYAKAEPIRMLFYKAGIQYEDVRVAFKDWPGLKSSNFSPSGQLPVLELDDGQKLTQVYAIMRLYATQHKLAPEDPMLIYHGDAALLAYDSDFWWGK